MSRRNSEIACTPLSQVLRAEFAALRPALTVARPPDTEENDDRRALFRELALANQLSDTPAVSAAYARAMRREALPGQLIQNPATLLWVLKKDWRE